MQLFCSTAIAGFGMSSSQNARLWCPDGTMAYLPLPICIEFTFSSFFLYIFAFGRLRPPVSVTCIVRFRSSLYFVLYPSKNRCSMFTAAVKKKKGHVVLSSAALSVVQCLRAATLLVPFFFFYPFKMTPPRFFPLLFRLLFLFRGRLPFLTERRDYAITNQ